MKMSLKSSPNWRLSEPPFAFQQTFVTPLSDLSKFVHALLAPFNVRTARVHVEQIVFEPRELIWYLRGLGIDSSEGQLNHALLEAESTTEIVDLLKCILGQWADFAFFPSPDEFAIYADHDEFTTVFVSSVEKMSSLRSAMKLKGFKEVEDWTWTGSRSPVPVEGN